MIKTFFSDGDAPATPFNTSLDKSSKKDSNKKIDYETIGMASTIQGLSQKNARMWQIIALVSLSSFFISLGICFYAVSLPKTIPVIVTVNPEGEANYVGKVDKNYWGSNQIPEIAKTFQIKSLIKNMYTKVIDKSAQQQYINNCEFICQGQAVRQLNDFFMNNNPWDNFGYVTRTVDIEEPLKQTEKTYIIYYNVTTRKNGYDSGVERYSMLVNLDFFDSVSEENILGIYISAFDIKKVEKQ